MRQLVTIFAVAVVILAVGGVAQAASYGYSVLSDGDDNLYQIDLSTGTATKIGPVGYGDVEGLSFQPDTGILFGWNDGGHLITINMLTGAGTMVGPSGLSSGQFDAGLTFDTDGNLFATNATASRLYGVNPSTGTTILIGATGTENVIALEYAGGNSLWGVSQDYDSQPLSFVSIDKNTGGTTVIGLMGLGSGISHGVGIDYGPGGSLWGIADSGQIFTVDTLTGQASIVANTLSGFEGLAVIPEPATMTLLGLGGLLLRRRKRA